MPFADDLIGAHTALALTRAIHTASPDDALAALHAASGALGPLALRERSDLLRDALLTDLDHSYDDFIAIIRKAAAADVHFSGWLIWPVTSAIADKALQDGRAEAFDDALAMLASLTSRLTSEFAIRTLLRHDLPRAMGVITSSWVISDDVDVRRLASEGTRSYLPWATRVPALLTDPQVTLPILNVLYRDDSDYVRRSVANHLNDLSRGHPDIVVDTARSWLAAPDGNTERLVGRALRTLIKRGDPGALDLLGFRPATLDVKHFDLDRDNLPVGDSVTFTADITNLGDTAARLSIDYVIHHRKADGMSTGKTFKLAVRTLAPGQSVQVSKTHSFRLITTRIYYPGTHAVELIINGVSAGRRELELTRAS
ncbi:DNA alkylation repair protein [Frigoribacterium sp. R86507]|uniref:DNA alkylation repair protein n=1 Tax=Frigoribacterium sp. R86507 TaxID=3093850 RepID=UPI0037CA478E